MKKSPEDLALFGGLPAFSEPLHVGRPNLGSRKRFMMRVNEMFDRNWLTNNGPFVQEFEHKLQDFTGVRHCITVCNATIGLEIVARALGLHGEVIVPSFTFVATAHALQWQEITPVFADVNPQSHNLDPQSVSRMITPRTSGIVGVHVWGRPCEIEALGQIAAQHNLKLMFDAAHAFGCTHHGQMIGNFGEAEVFSFHATKFFNSFEGGAIATNNDELAHRIRQMINFGFAGYDTVTHVGTNGKMTEISAAMGLTSLESLDEVVETNRRNHHAYAQELAALPGLHLIEYNPDERNNYQYIIVEVDEKTAGLSRNELVRILHAENVLARRYFYPGCHRMEPYRSLFPHAGLLLPETNRLTDKVISLPNGVAIAPAEIRALCQILRFCLEQVPELRRRLEAV